MLASIRTLSATLLIILTHNFQPLYSEGQATPITFFNLEEAVQHDGQLVTIRGFLYESPESHLILAAEPNLKSCCVGSTSKRQRQLLVTGDLDPASSGSNAVTLQGNLVVAMGDTFPLRLENSSFIPQKDQCYWMLGLAGLGVLLLSGGAFFFFRKKQDPQD